MAENNNLVLKKISDLSNLNFFIPFFQRGYRWDIMQVEDLLNDIKEYIDMENKESFLCLQPVVVYEKEGKYVVIDGQQRLTTIAIIKYYLFKQLGYNIEYEKNIDNNPYKNYKNLYTILSNAVEKITKKINAFIKKYELHDYLKQDNINTIDELLKNLDSNKANHKLLISLTNELLSEKCSLDEYHIILSYLVIAYYFNKNCEYKDKFNKLFTSIDGNNSIQFIWYNVTDEINNDEKKAIEIFTRLNIGKIPLTDAELIKALFLKKDNFKESEIDKISIATLWYEMEKDLNDDSFWYFLSKDNIPRYKRINLLLILNSEIDSINNVQNYNLFSEYYKKMKNNSYSDIWAKIKQIYYTLKEWYHNYEMYHYIGYLTNLGYNLKTLYNKYHNTSEQNSNNNNTKQNSNNTNEKITILNKKIQRGIIKEIVKEKINQINIEELSFNKKENIKKILLFLEIYSAIKANENSVGKLNNEVIYRFPFNLYTNEQWDIEHISSQTENRFQKNEDKLIWLENNIKYYKSNEYKFNKIITNLNTYECNFLLDIISDNSKNLKDILKDNVEDITKKWDCIFNSFTIDVEEQSQLDDNQKNSIGNLVLLNSKINRSYKNAIFPVKRMVIVEESKKNTFIPVNTKNAFLKYYNSDETGTLNQWNIDDYENYTSHIFNEIKDFKGEM